MIVFIDCAKSPIDLAAVDSISRFLKSRSHYKAPFTLQACTLHLNVFGIEIGETDLRRSETIFPVDGGIRLMDGPDRNLKSLRGEFVLLNGEREVLSERRLLKIADGSGTKRPTLGRNVR